MRLVCGRTILLLGKCIPRENSHRDTVRCLTWVFDRFVKTQILSQAAIENLEKAGTEFATVEAAARAVMKICSDTSINGTAAPGLLIIA